MKKQKEARARDLSASWGAYPLILIGMRKKFYDRLMTFALGKIQPCFHREFYAKEALPKL